MLPDIPKTKSQISRQLRQRLRNKTKFLSPLIRLGQSITQHEGLTHSYEQAGFGVVEEGFAKYEVPIEIRFDEIPELTGERLVAKIDSLAEELARQTSTAGFRKLEQEIEKAGNRVHADGSPITQELYLEMLEKMEMSFDEGGNPEITFILHPEMAKVVRPLIEEWHRNADFRKRYDQLMVLKREAWRDRESNRKLVD